MVHKFSPSVKFLTRGCEDFLVEGVVKLVIWQTIIAIQIIMMIFILCTTAGSVFLQMMRKIPIFEGFLLQTFVAFKVYPNYS